MEEEFDLSEVKVMDENGEAQPVELPQEETQEEIAPNEELTDSTEDVQEQTTEEPVKAEEPVETTAWN